MSDQLHLKSICLDRDTATPSLNTGKKRIETDGTNLYFNGGLVNNGSNVAADFTVQEDLYIEGDLTHVTSINCTDSLTVGNVYSQTNPTGVKIELGGSDVTVTSNLLLTEMNALATPTPSGGFQAKAGQVYYNGTQLSGMSTNVWSVVTTDRITSHTGSPDLVTVGANLEVEADLRVGELVATADALTVRSNTITLVSETQTARYTMAGANPGGNTSAFAQIDALPSDISGRGGRVVMRARDTGVAANSGFDSVEDAQLDVAGYQTKTTSGSAFVVGPDNNANLGIGVGWEPAHKLTVGASPGGDAHFAIDTVNNKTILKSGMQVEFATNTDIQQLGGEGSWVRIGTTQPVGYNSVGIGYQSGSSSSSSVSIGTRAGSVGQGKESVAIGRSAGTTEQGYSSVAIGDGAGSTSQGITSTAIGKDCGRNKQGEQSIAIGKDCGRNNQGATSLAIGAQCGKETQGVESTAIGYLAANQYQSKQATAIGYRAGAYNQGPESTSIGFGAGEGVFAGVGQNQGTQATAIGYRAGRIAQGTQATAVGYLTGQTSQGVAATCISAFAGQVTQGSRATAIGYAAGQTSQGDEATAIGYLAGQIAQGATALAIGNGAGQTSQGVESVAVGYNAANDAQSSTSTALGAYAGESQQREGATAVGYGAGRSLQGSYAIAIGQDPAADAQGAYGIAIGYQTADTTQGDYSIAVGYEAGKTTQGQRAIAIGYEAGWTSQGSESIAVGSYIGKNVQHPNTILLNASGTELDSTASGGWYVKPIADTATTAGLKSLFYDSGSGEIKATTTTGKSFVIDHPTPSATRDKYLVHTCLEGPEVGVYYRGKGAIPPGECKTTVHLPGYVSDLIIEDSETVQLTPMFNGVEIRTLNVGVYDRAANAFNVHGHGPCAFNWVFYAKRSRDYEVEPRKSDTDLRGDGPYTYLLPRGGHVG